jgi:hypothetical protein
MHAEEKRRLKKLGKQRVEQQSRELRERLVESNPAPVGSDEWARNYKQGTLKEKELRQQHPDIIYGAEVERDFVVNPIEPISHGVPTHYIQCVRCCDVLHSCPTRDTKCSCGGIFIALSNGQTMITADSQSDIQWVKLIGKGTAELGSVDQKSSHTQYKPWWQFWK